MFFSLLQVEDAVLDLPMGKHDIDSLSEIDHEEAEDFVDMQLERRDKCYRIRSSGRINSEPAVILTQVESDRPAFVSRMSAESRNMDKDTSLDSAMPKSTLSLSQRSDSSSSSNDIVTSLNSSASVMSMKYCKYEKASEDKNVLSKCRSEEIVMKSKKRKNIDNSVNEKSKSDEIFHKEEVNIIGGGMRRVRRESCELALQTGRISPQHGSQE